MKSTGTAIIDATTIIITIIITIITTTTGKDRR